MNSPFGHRLPRGALLVQRHPSGGICSCCPLYATAFYNVGDTNAGAIVTVACDSTSTAFTAISGGVQVLGIGGTQGEIDAAN